MVDYEYNTNYENFITQKINDLKYYAVKYEEYFISDIDKKTIEGILYVFIETYKNENINTIKKDIEILFDLDIQFLTDYLFYSNKSIKDDLILFINRNNDDKINETKRIKIYLEIAILEIYKRFI